MSEKDDTVTGIFMGAVVGLLTSILGILLFIASKLLFICQHIFPGWHQL